MGSDDVINEFLQVYLTDQEQGQLRTADEYASLFPGFETEIRQELSGTGNGTSKPRLEAIGPYRILEEIGRGGQGRVYLAQDERLGGRRVALKVMAGVHGLSRVAHLRFLREAELASKLDHPAICTVYEAGDQDGLLYIAMRYLEGTGLSGWIESRDVDPRPVQQGAH